MAGTGDLGTAQAHTSDRATATAVAACQSCGTPHARHWSTPQGPARLCPPCAALHGVGCP